MPTPTFIPQARVAKRLACKAAIMIEGLTGKGKSGLALAIGRGLAKGEWKKVGVIDSENQSINLFAGIGCSTGGTYGEFIETQLTEDIGYSPTNYLYLRDYLLHECKVSVVIEDSITHAWQYKGGVLDLVSIAKTKSAHFSRDKYAAWGDEDVVREKNELLSLIRDPRCHVITTVRVKERFEYGKDGDKTTLTSVGEQQIQQADLKYEPDLVLHMLRPGKNRGGVVVHPLARVIKSRYAILDEGTEYEFTPELIEQLREYLEDGINPEELLEKQRKDYVLAVKEYLDNHQAAVAIWKVMKKDSGHDATKLEDMPLAVIKPMFIRLTSD